MKLNCAIIEDEPLAQKILESYINRIEDLVLVGTADNIIQFRKLTSTVPISIILLDLRLRGTAREEIVNLLKEDYIIILVTAYSVKHLDGLNLFKIEAVLNKPVSFEQFSKCITKVFAKLNWWTVPIFNWL